MNRRLQLFLEAEGISQAQFADEIEVTRSSVSNVLGGRNKPSCDFIQALVEHYPSLSIEWLLTGRGKMNKSGDGPVHQKTIDEPTLFPIRSDEIAQLDENPKFVESPTVPRENSILTADAEPEPQSPEKRISKIIVFYDDNSFIEIS